MPSTAQAFHGLSDATSYHAVSSLSTNREASEDLPTLPARLLDDLTSALPKARRCTESQALDGAGKTRAAQKSSTI